MRADLLLSMTLDEINASNEFAEANPGAKEAEKERFLREFRKTKRIPAPKPARAVMRRRGTGPEAIRTRIAIDPLPTRPEVMKPVVERVFSIEGSELMRDYDRMRSRRYGPEEVEESSILETATVVVTPVNPTPPVAARAINPEPVEEMLVVTPEPVVVVPEVVTDDDEEIITAVPTPSVERPMKPVIPQVTTHKYDPTVQPAAKPEPFARLILATAGPKPHQVRVKEIPPKPSDPAALLNQLTTGAEVRAAWEQLVNWGVVQRTPYPPSTVVDLKKALRAQMGSDWVTKLAARTTELQELIN